MRVVILKRKLAKGVQSLYIDYYIDGERKRDCLELYIYPGRHIENKEAMRIAEIARSQRQHEITSGVFGLIATHHKKMDFFIFMRDFCARYKKADYKMYNALIPCFREFVGQDSIPCGAISDRMMRDFNKYLHDNYNGETPFNYFKAFKRILKSAVEEGLFIKNPADGIRNVNTKQNQLTKQVLMADEIQLLARTICGNAEVKRSFLFATQTGLRKCDIKKLQWKHVVLGADNYIDFGQVKTGVRNFIPLNEAAVDLLQADNAGGPNDYIFNLSISDTAVNDNIEAWVKRAGIKKHITFHCARHSLGTNLLIAGVDLKTTSKTLGHTSTRHTEKYTHISEAMKQQAVKKLPKLKV